MSDTLTTETETQGALEQAASFLQILLRLHQAINGQITPALERHGLSMRLYLILRQIETGIAYPGALSKAMQLPNNVITRYIDQLVDLDLLQRSIDSDDSRRIKLTLTKKGSRVLADVHRAIRAIVAARLQRLSPDRQKAFMAAYAELAADDSDRST